MKALSKSTWLCLGLTFLCVLQSIHLNYISREPLRTTASSQYPHQVDEISSQQQTPQEIASSSTKNINPLIDDTLLSDDPSSLFYFIQVSDLHISKFRPQTEHFLHFIQSVLPMVRPSFVVVTGDLTDAKDIGDIKTQQYEEEWQLYKHAIDQGTTDFQENGLPWYDMRGNHDCFDLPSWESNINLYRTFGKSARLLEDGQGVYSWQMKHHYGNYRFVAMDACPKKGPARPLNFYGYITTNTMDRLESTLLDETATYNHTFLFTHYPTTTMVFGQSSLGRTFKDLLQRTSIYFCGHLHRLAFGLGDILKSYNTATKSLELELGDMKDHGVYRIMAVDHDLVSFVDVELPLDAVQPSSPADGNPYRFPLADNNTILWPDKIQLAPVILITNPKDARYFLNDKEPTGRIRDSTHVRFLVFSSHHPSTLKVRVFVDNKRHPFAATFSGNKDSPPLWTTPWSPEDFDDITAHSLRIQVTAPDGQVGESQVFFRVDNVRLMIGGGFGEWLIGTSVANIFKYTAILGLAFMLLLLLGPKIYTDLVTMGQQQQNDDDTYSKACIAPSTSIMLSLHNLDANPYAGPYQCIERQALAWLLRFFQFPAVMPAVFYTTLLFVLSFLCLPWFHAEFIPSADRLTKVGTDGRYGTFYLWGVIFDNEWLPLGDTFMFATFHLAFDVGVFLILFAWRATDAEDLYCPSTMDNGGTVSSSPGQQWNRKVWFKVCEVIYWLWRMDSVMTIGAFYGGMWPTLVGNLLVWWMFFAAGVLLFGKNGLALYRSDRNKTRLQTTLNGCQHCRVLTTSSSGTTLAAAPQLPPSFYNQPHPIQQDPTIPANVSATSTASHDHTPMDEDLDFSESSVTSTSSSSSTTNANGIRYKGRRKGNHSLH